MPLPPVDSVALDLVYQSWKTAGRAAQRRQVYGRTTGVGANRDTQVEQQIEQDSRLLRSHATGAGEFVPHGTVRAAMLVRLNQLLAGGSGMHPAIIDALVASLDSDDLPRVHASSSIGTGDLSQFAEIGLGLIGEAALESGRVHTLWTPSVGDALALISTNAMGIARGLLANQLFERWLDHCQATACLALIATQGSAEPFADQVHQARPQPGQAEVAADVRHLLRGHHWHPKRVQDSYGFRALPQVLGSARNALNAYSTTLNIELNSAAENPLVSAIDDDVFHNANFHALPLAAACDHSKLALASAAQLSGRRLANLTEPAITDLRPFLAGGPPGSSGIMLLEYIGAAALSRLRSAAFPATLGTTVISRGTEDHASFGSQATDQLHDCISAANEVLACELQAAVRALSLSKVSLDSSTPLGSYFLRARHHLNSSMVDRPLGDDHAAAVTFLRQPAGLKGNTDV
ncbi:aromatic amino acid ammonia-lyase [Rhodococcus sp. NPDC057529]|uniref:aromatic amino acid ammonia-lyase n=1 Tax=Rhodococcus sp. NPDC057529 TaxID=3346158 RepID=UPI003672C8BD